MIVYLITNKINDKKYIGLTKRSIKVRWYEHVKKSKESKLSELSLHNDIKIHGKENFELIILKECSSISEMCFFEKKYISEYKTIKNGYNRNSGGQFYELSNRYREEMSKNSIDSKEVQVYNIKGEYMNTYESVNKSCRELNIDPRKVFRVLSGKRKSCSGYIFSYIKNESIKIVNENITPVYAYNSKNDLIGKYSSIKECGLQNGINVCYISRVISKKRLHHKGIYYFTSEQEHFTKRKNLYQYDKSGNLLNIFDNIRDASNNTGINISSLSKISSNLRKSKLFDFKWL